MKLWQVGSGVVVAVVSMKVQHASLSHSPAAQTLVPAFREYPSGQEKLSHIGAGVVVTVRTIGAAVLQGFDGGCVEAGVGSDGVMGRAVVDAVVVSSAVVD